MFPIKQLRQSKADKMKEIRAVLDTAAAQGRDLNPTEAAQHEVMSTEVVKLSAEIQRVEGLMDEERLLGRTLGITDNDMNPRYTAGFASMADFMGALFRRSRGDFDDRLKSLVYAGITEGEPASGGFAVPPQFVFRALNEDLDDTVLLKLCDRIPMSAKELHVPGFADSSHSSTAPFGIVWRQIAESASFGDAQGLPFNKIELVAKKSGALFAVSNEWLGDANPAMRERVETIFRTSLRWYVENLLWAGTGAAEPLGALNGPGTLAIPKETGQEAATICTENIVKMWSRLRPGSHSRGIWVGNPTTFPQLATLTVGVGTGGALTGLLQTNRGVAGEPATAIFGRPLYLSEHLPAVGQAGDLVLLDPLLYILGDRQLITMDASPHVRFSYDETTFRVSARFDGQPALASVLTPKNGSTLAWAVKIAVRA